MTKLIVAIGFVLALSAGLVLGLNYERSFAHPGPGLGGPMGSGGPGGPGGGPGNSGGPGRHGWLAQQLGLTTDQQKQLDEIWSDTARRGGPQQGDQHRQLRRDRDEAISRLIHEEDRAAYEQVLHDYDDKARALETEWRASYQRAVEKTKAILTPEQRQKYETLLSRQGWGPPGMGGERRRSETRPDESKTQPSTSETPELRQTPDR